METFDAIPRFVKSRVRIVDPALDLEAWASSDTEELPTKIQTVVMYRRGPGCPVPVELEVDRILTEYNKEYPDRSLIGTEYTLNEYVDKVRRVNTLLRRNLLLAVSHKLDMELANILAHDDSHGRELLVRAEWLGEVEESTVNAAENKTEGNDETGESILQTSSPPIQE